MVLIARKGWRRLSTRPDEQELIPTGSLIPTESLILGPYVEFHAHAGYSFGANEFCRSDLAG
jgi:hypothetical protein